MYCWKVELTTVRTWAIGVVERLTQFTTLSEKPPTCDTWSGRDWQRWRQHPGPNIYGHKLGRICRKHFRQKAKKRHWAHKMPKFDNARTWRGISYIEPDDMEFKDTITNARKKLEVTLESVMPCESSNQQEAAFLALNNSRKSRCACIIWSPRINQNAHWDDWTQRSWRSHLGERVQFVDSLQPCAQNYFFTPSNENPGCESRSWQKMGKARKFASMASDEIQQQKRGVIEKAQKEERSVHFATLMDLCLKDSKLELKFPRYKGRVVLLVDGAKDDSRSYAVCLQSRVRQHHWWWPQQVWTLLPDYLDAKKQATQYRLTTKSKWKKLQNCWRTSCVFGKEFVRSILLQVWYGKDNSISFTSIWMGESTNLGMYVRSSPTRIILIHVRGRHQDGRKETQFGVNVDTFDEQGWSGDTNAVPWSRLLRMHSAWMQVGPKSRRRIQKRIRIANVRRTNREVARFLKRKRTSDSVVLRRGRTCAKISRTILRDGKTKNL